MAGVELSGIEILVEFVLEFGVVFVVVFDIGGVTVGVVDEFDIVVSVVFDIVGVVVVLEIVVLVVKLGFEPVADPAVVFEIVEVFDKVPEYAEVFELVEDVDVFVISEEFVPIETSDVFEITVVLNDEEDVVVLLVSTVEFVTLVLIGIVVVFIMVELV